MMDMQLRRRQVSQLVLLLLLLVLQKVLMLHPRTTASSPPCRRTARDRVGRRGARHPEVGRQLVTALDGAVVDVILEVHLRASVGEGRRGQRGRWQWHLVALV